MHVCIIYMPVLSFRTHILVLTTTTTSKRNENEETKAAKQQKKKQNIQILDNVLSREPFRQTVSRNRTLWFLFCFQYIFWHKFNLISARTYRGPNFMRSYFVVFSIAEILLYFRFLFTLWFLLYFSSCGVSFIISLFFSL